ncbi:chorismate mutase [Rhodococcus sp. RS1C4]|nr:chorismate mutase [Rhodococcus sp. RS1C4]OZC46368.1 chorismate mutase [Rhodococcus sp. RS1C4]
MTDEPGSQLESLRGELDALDARILESIQHRIEICSRVALVKREFDIPMMQPGRVGVVQDRARAFAREHGLSEDFLTSVYDLLIGEACRVEDLIIDDRESIDADVSVGERGR